MPPRISEGNRVGCVRAFHASRRASYLFPGDRGPWLLTTETPQQTQRNGETSSLLASRNRSIEKIRQWRLSWGTSWLVVVNWLPNVSLTSSTRKERREENRNSGEKKEKKEDRQVNANGRSSLRPGGGRVRTGHYGTNSRTITLPPLSAFNGRPSI